MAEDIGKELSRVVSQIQQGQSRAPTQGSTIPQSAFVTQEGKQYSEVERKGLRALRAVDRLYAGYHDKISKGGTKALLDRATLWGTQLWRYPDELIEMALFRFADKQDPQYKNVPPQLPALAPHIEALIVQGLPGEEEAWLEATLYANRGQHEWSHDVVYHAARSTGFFELQTQSDEPRVRNSFNAHYAISREKFMRGEELVKPNPVMLEDKSDVTSAIDYNSWVNKLESEHNLDRATAADLCNYMMRQPGSLRRTMYKQAVEKASALGVTLPAEPEAPQRESSLSAQQIARGRAMQADLKRLFAVSERELARKDRDDE